MRLVFTSLLLLTTVFLNAKAQTADEVSQLTPYPVYLEKKRIEIERIRKENKHSNSDIFYDYPKPSKIKANFTVEPKSLPTGVTMVAVTATTTLKDVDFQEIGGEFTFKIAYFGRITSKDKSIDGVFEEQTVMTVEVDDLTTNYPATKNNQISYQKTIALPKGKYTLYFRMIDGMGNKAIKKFKFEIK